MSLSNNGIPIKHFANLSGNNYVGGPVIIDGPIVYNGNDWVFPASPGEADGVFTTIDSKTEMLVVSRSSFFTDTTLRGTTTVTGTITDVQTTDVTVTDNEILVNSGEAGAGVTSGTAGIRVDRGTLTDYEFKFDDSTDTFRIGEIGSLQAVATREDTPIDGYIPVWNSTSLQFDTANGLTLAEATQLQNINSVTISTAQWGYLGLTDQSLSTTSSVEFAQLTVDQISIDNAIINFTGATSTNQLVIPDNLPDAFTITDGSENYIQITTTTGSDEIKFLQNVDITGAVTISGTVDTRDVATDGSTLDNLNTTLGFGSLTAIEVAQLGNINTTTISTGQWGYLGAATQAVATTDTVAFNQVTIDQTLINAGLITLSGATTTNQLVIPDNLADALTITDGTQDYIQIVSTTGSDQIKLLQNTEINGRLDILTNNELRLQDASGGQYVAWKSSPTVSTSYTFVMPPAEGAVGQVLDVASVAANVVTLQWTTPSGGVSYPLLGSVGAQTVPTYAWTGGSGFGNKGMYSNVVNFVGFSTSGVICATIDSVGDLYISDENEIRWQDAAGGDYVSVGAPTTITSSYSMNWPVASVDNSIIRHTTGGATEYIESVIEKSGSLAENLADYYTFNSDNTTQIGYSGTGIVFNSPTSTTHSINEDSSSFLTVNVTNIDFGIPMKAAIYADPTARDAAVTSPSAGMVIYVTSLNKLQTYTTSWETITST